jgi:2-polyprenyl-3-methyl-5-hydroxy-6-metoxy-1,4-benzoquinol methylase
VTIQKNTPELWDAIWEKPTTAAQDRYTLAKERHTVRWRRIARKVHDVYGGFADRQVIEIGAGAGTVGALMAQDGARVTILDYSDLALDRAREFYGRHGLAAEYVNVDALELPPEWLGRFDIAMSFGLAEHFAGANRRKIIQAHLDVLRPGGLTFISVPNKYCPPYRLFKFVAQRAGKWAFGEEYPASRAELLRIADTLGVSERAVMGGSFGASWDFVNPFKALAIVRRVFRLRDTYDETRLRHEIGTPLDSWLSYALVLYARKRQGAAGPETAA